MTIVRQKQRVKQSSRDIVAQQIVKVVQQGVRAKVTKRTRINHGQRNTGWRNAPRIESHSAEKAQLLLLLYYSYYYNYYYYYYIG